MTISGFITLLDALRHSQPISLPTSAALIFEGRLGRLPKCCSGDVLNAPGRELLRYVYFEERLIASRRGNSVC